MRFRNHFDISIRREPMQQAVNGVLAPTLVNKYVHLLHNYRRGQKPSSGCWRVLEETGDRLVIDYLPTHTKLTRLRSQVCPANARGTIM